MKENYNHSITIRINFRYGHRLISPYKGKCNNVHGEYGTAIIEFSSKELDINDMVLDFGGIKKEIKSWIDINWDHAYIYNDKDEVGKYLKEAGLKVFELTNTNPTAEILSAFLFKIIKLKISDKVIKVGIVESSEDNIAWYEE